MYSTGCGGGRGGRRDRDQRGQRIRGGRAGPQNPASPATCSSPSPWTTFPVDSSSTGRSGSVGRATSSTTRPPSIRRAGVGLLGRSHHPGLAGREPAPHAQEQKSSLIVYKCADELGCRHATPRTSWRRHRAGNHRGHAGRARRGRPSARPRPRDRIARHRLCRARSPPARRCRLRCSSGCPRSTA